MYERSALPSGITAKANWQQLLTLFEELSGIPESERESRIKEKQLDAATQSKLEHMLRTLNHTISILDTPIANRVQLPQQWYADKWVGRRLNQYKLNELLHEGNVAGVFRATQIEPVKRQVAIKLLRPEVSEQYQANFRSEQRTLAKLSHPSIASIHTVEESEEGLSFSVMEYIEGDVLSKYCNDKTLSIEQRLELFLDICDAVSYAHQRGVLHRDLKSSNILVRNFEGKPIPSVIDFEISSDLNDYTEGLDDYLMGTPEYMSPEHVLAQNDMDVRADVYSLGMVLFTLLVGVIPFDRVRMAKLSRAQRLSLIAEFETCRPSEHFLSQLLPDQQNTVAEQRSTNIKSLAKRLSGELDLIFEKATERSRDARYATVTDLANDIENHLANKVIAAHPPSLLYSGQKFWQRNTLSSLLVVSILTVGAIFSTKLITQNNEMALESNRAEQEKLNAEQTAELILETLQIAEPATANSIGRESVSEILHRVFAGFHSASGVSPEFRARLLIKLSSSFRNTENDDKAKEVDSILVAELESFEPQTQADVLIALAQGAYHDGYYQSLLQYGQQIEELSIEHDVSVNSQIRAKVIIGDAYRINAELEKANASLNGALAMFEQHSYADPPLRARIYLALAALGKSQRMHENIEDYYTQAISLYSDHYGENHRSVVNARKSEFQFLILSKNPRATSDSARVLLKDVVRIWGEDSGSENFMLYHLATLLRTEGNTEAAKLQFLRNLESLERQDRRRNQMYVANMAMLSLTYLELDEPIKALEVTTISANLIDSTKEGEPEVRPYLKAAVNLEHANSLTANGKTEIALGLLESVVSYFQKSGENEITRALLLRAYVYAAHEDYEYAALDVQSVYQFLNQSSLEKLDAESRIAASAMEHYVSYKVDPNQDGLVQLIASIKEYRELMKGRTLPFPYSEIRAYAESERVSSTTH